MARPSGLPCQLKQLKESDMRWPCKATIPGWSLQLLYGLCWRMKNRVKAGMAGASPGPSINRGPTIDGPRLSQRSIVVAPLAGAMPPYGCHVSPPSSPPSRIRQQLLFVVVLGMLILSACTPTPIVVSKKASTRCQPDRLVGFLRGFHSELVDASGCQVRLLGVNWSGFESGTFVPHGLEERNWQDMLKQIARTGFNTIRLPFSNQLFDPASQPQGINYQLNPDLKGLSGLALLERIIQGAGKLGLRVILDRHDPMADQRPPLWYTDQAPGSSPCGSRGRTSWCIRPMTMGRRSTRSSGSRFPTRLSLLTRCLPSGRSIGPTYNRMGPPRCS